MDTYNKKRFKHLLEKDSNFKKLLKFLLDYVRIESVSITPENDNDWIVVLADNPTIMDICPVCKDGVSKIMLELREDDENGSDYKIATIEETINILKKDINSSSEDDYDVEFSDEYDEFVVSNAELKNILVEDVLFLAQKAKEENVCKSAMKYLNKYFIQTEDERIFPKKYFKGKKFQHVLKNMLKHEAKIMRSKTLRGTHNHVLNVMNSAYWHLDCMKIYGRRVPRKGLKIS